MVNQKYLNIFERFLPQEAAKYCHDLWSNMGFEFKITKSRKSKYGDFRFDPGKKKSTISVNHDLNPYAFLVTYLHEVAHFMTHQEHGNKVQPHGKEWKQNFKKVAIPMLKPEILPDPILRSFSGYLKNPAATSCSDPHLTRVLSQYNDGSKNEIMLFDIPIGSNFQFRNKVYQSLEKKRTRLVCLEIKTGRKYLINGVAQVKPI